jgi:hypothetical protein
MVLSIVGGLLLALGLFAGTALVLVPLGLAHMADGAALWVLFPLFSVIGFTLFATGARIINLPSILFGVSCLLLVLAVASAAGLVLEATALLQPAGSTLALWYVMAVAGVLGSIGAATHAKVRPA